MPSFLSTKRSKVITVAAAGTLTLAAAISAAAVTIPSSSSPASAAVEPAFMTAISQQAAQAPQSVPADGIQQAALLKARVLQAERSEQVSAAKAAAKAAAEKAAAAKAAAQQAAAKQAAAQSAQQAAVTASSGSPEQVAEQMLGQFGWSASQFSCLQPLWERESGWNVTAQNPSSGAYGIPQALPGSKMATAGADWQTDAATQIRWGLTYIQGSYGSPCAAWAHEQADGWY